MDTTTIKENVRTILIEFPQTRDCEPSLWYFYYLSFCGLTKGDTITELALLQQKKKIPSIQSIMRYSRQIQEKEPNLRGEKWNKRQRKQKEVKKELGYK